MSYVVQIWENPINKPFPATIDTALQILETLQSCQLSDFNPKFIALAERLKQRYPDMDSVSFDEDEDDDFDFSELAWTDLRLNGKTLDAVYGLGINVNDLFEEVRPFVMQEATALGLCVMDEQAGEVYLPDGKVLLPTDPSMKSQLTSDVVRNIIFERLTPIMLEHGYTACNSKHSFIRSCSESWCELELWSPFWTKQSPFAEVGVLITLRCHVIADLICKVAYPDKSPEDIAKTITLALSSERWMEYSEEFEAGWGGDTVLNELNKLMQSWRK